MGGWGCPPELLSCSCHKVLYIRVPFLAFSVTVERALIAFYPRKYSTFRLCGISSLSQPRGKGERSGAEHYDPLAIPPPLHLALYTKINIFLCVLLTNIKKAIDVCIFILYNDKCRQQAYCGENAHIG